MGLIRSGHLAIPLFHGTSSLFADSILERGLGARNPIEELRVLPFLHAGFEICEQVCADQEDWQVERVSVEKMVRQGVTPSGFNFRHGHCYLTAVRLTAVRHALNNAWGSEAVTTASRLYGRVRKDARGRLGELACFQPLLKLLGQERRPILVSVEDVEISALEGESGRSTTETIAYLQECGEHHRDEFAILTQQANFRLTAPVPAAKLKVFEIEVKRADQVFPDYQTRQVWP
jgi:hypothetical protein